MRGDLGAGRTVHLLNGLLDDVPVVAIVGQTTRSALGGSYQQEVGLGTLCKGVCHHYVTTVKVRELSIGPSGLRRRATSGRHIVPSDVQELTYEAPGHAFKVVPSFGRRQQLNH